MARRDQIDMHVGRALAELECARAAACDAAAIAHLELSELHLGRMRDLEVAPMPALRLVREPEPEQSDPAEREYGET